MGRRRMGRRRLGRPASRSESSLSRGFDLGEAVGSGDPDGLGHPNTGWQSDGDGEGGRGVQVFVGGNGAPQLAPNGRLLPNPK